MMGPGMFAGVLEAVLVAALILGIVFGLLAFGIPGYFIGKHYGRQEVYQEAIDKKLLQIQYDPRSGEKVYIWVKPSK